MPLDDDAVVLDGVLPVSDADLFMSVDDLLSVDDLSIDELPDLFIEPLGGVDGELCVDGVLLLELGLDCAIAPDSANALSATPIISLFNILASKSGFAWNGGWFSPP
jgi:hypothetical protein